LEASRFRDVNPELKQAGVQLVGVSSDSHDTQCGFAKKMGANFPMIGDEKRDIIAKFGVKWPLVKLAKRVTFVIDEKGVIRDVFRHEIDAGEHAVDVVAAVKRLKNPAASVAGTPH
jgi:peroxiredoxin Q/BCP